MASLIGHDIGQFGGLQWILEVIDSRIPSVKCKAFLAVVGGDRGCRRPQPTWKTKHPCWLQFGAECKCDGPCP